jgi:hypothetical protein
MGSRYSPAALQGRYLTIPQRSALYLKTLRYHGRKVRKTVKITDLPAELLLSTLREDCLGNNDFVNVTQVYRELSKPATSLLFHTLSTTVLEDSSFDMR